MNSTASVKVFPLPALALYTVSCFDSIGSETVEYVSKMHVHFLNCQNATAAAAATFSESTWFDMGMRAT